MQILNHADLIAKICLPNIGIGSLSLASQHGIIGIYFKILHFNILSLFI